MKRGASIKTPRFTITEYYPCFTLPLKPRKEDH